MLDALRPLTLDGDLLFATWFARAAGTIVLVLAATHGAFAHNGPTTRAEIAAGLSAVAAFASEPDNAPRWYVNIKSVDWETPRPMQIGSRFAFVAQFLGRRLEYVYEVVQYVPDKQLVMRTSDGPFPMETTYEWEPIETGTRMTCEIGARYQASRG